MSTWHARVGDLEVGLELGVAAGGLLEERVWNSQGAMSSTGTAHRHDVHHIRVASDESEVRSHAASNAHASVACRAYHHHFAFAALGLEHFGQTVISRLCNHSQHNLTTEWLHTIRYDTVYLRTLKSRQDGQLNLAHGTETKKIRKN